VERASERERERVLAWQENSGPYHVLWASRFLGLNGLQTPNMDFRL
jgi:hypothetical protein